MRVLRLFLFITLMAASIALMAVSFIGPWWTAYIQNLPGTESTINMVVNLYQWGIPKAMQSENWAADITPLYQIILARIYLAISVVLAFLSIWLKGNKGKYLLLFIGLSWIIYAAGALILIYNRTGEYEIMMQGSVTLYTYNIVVTSGLRIGYYLAYLAGALCIVCALMRKRLTEAT